MAKLINIFVFIVYALAYNNSVAQTSVDVYELEAQSHTLFMFADKDVKPKPDPDPDPDPKPSVCEACENVGWITQGDGHTTKCYNWNTTCPAWDGKTPPKPRNRIGDVGIRVIYNEETPNQVRLELPCHEWSSGQLGSLYTVKDGVAYSIYEDDHPTTMMQISELSDEDQEYINRYPDINEGYVERAPPAHLDLRNYRSIKWTSRTRVKVCYGTYCVFFNVGDSLLEQGLHYSQYLREKKKPVTVLQKQRTIPNTQYNPPNYRYRRWNLGNRR